ncbi:L-asparaginase type II [Penicillium fimorum]|uniref:asparaginase n=1 Tax=Penicillium fimorum TaxID=1882269 RepID=A0A9W9Y6J1_9EURO|nr:L-asparaginase type II [Penicillium fimorum]
MGFSLQTLVVSALAITSHASPLIYSRTAHTCYTNSNGLAFNHFNSFLPKVTILATDRWRTIAGTNNDKTATAGYESDALGINSLLSEIPYFFNIANIAGKQRQQRRHLLFLLLSLTHKLRIEVCDDPTMSRAVITHGTDTLEESVFFIDATVNCGKPIGVTVAADNNSKDRRALVVLNDRIVSAFFATKTNAVQPNAKHVVDVSDVDAVPRVDILYAYADMQVDSIYSAVKNGVKGIVVAGEGAGGVSTGFASAINDIVAKHNIPVVLSHRTVNGEVPAADITGENAKTQIASGMFNPQKPRILLIVVG